MVKICLVFKIGATVSYCRRWLVKQHPDKKWNNDQIRWFIHHKRKWKYFHAEIQTARTVYTSFHILQAYFVSNANISSIPSLTLAFICPFESSMTSETRITFEYLLCFYWDRGLFINKKGCSLFYLLWSPCQSKQAIGPYFLSPYY